MSNDTIVPETSGSVFGSSIPELGRCVAVGTSRDEVPQRIGSALKIDLAAMRAEIAPIPKPSSHAIEVSIGA